MPSGRIGFGIAFGTFFSAFAASAASFFPSFASAFAPFAPFAPGTTTGAAGVTGVNEIGGGGCNARSSSFFSARSFCSAEVVPKSPPPCFVAPPDGVFATWKSFFSCPSINVTSDVASSSSVGNFGFFARTSVPYLITNFPTVYIRCNAGFCGPCGPCGIAPGISDGNCGTGSGPSCGMKSGSFCPPGCSGSFSAPGALGSFASKTPGFVARSAGPALGVVAGVVSPGFTGSTAGGKGGFASCPETVKGKVASMAPSTNRKKRGKISVVGMW